MKISDLNLENFRNFDTISLKFTAPVTLILAPNTSGKTNILEAIFYLATSRSFRADLEQEIIQRDKNFCNIEGRASNANGDVSLRIFLQKSSEELPLAQKRLEVNGVSRRSTTFIANFHAVLFTPEDLNLISESPSRRRKYLDTVLSQISPDYHTAISQYQKIITQRNKLLEKIRENNTTIEQLYYWNDKLLKLGKLIYDQRKDMMEIYNGEMKIVGSDLHSKGKDLALIYYPSILTAERLSSYQKKEIDSGQSLIGPHRDDFAFYWRGMDLEKYGSRGEQRLGILALKIAELHFIEQKTTERPVLLLDDIFSELDEVHRKNLTQLFKNQQTIITSTEEEVVDSVKQAAESEIIELKRS